MSSEIPVTTDPIKFLLYFNTWDYYKNFNNKICIDIMYFSFYWL